MSPSASPRRSLALKWITALALFVAPFPAYAQSSASMTKANLRDSMDKLWADVSAAADLPERSDRTTAAEPRRHVATEKTAEGIRKFVADMAKLKQVVASRI